MKICPVESKLFLPMDRKREDRQTDMTKLIVTFHNFVNVHENLILIFYVNDGSLY